MMCDYCYCEANPFGSHDFECSDKGTKDVKSMMNVDAGVIPDKKILEINIGFNSIPIFIDGFEIGYCPKCGRRL